MYLLTTSPSGRARPLDEVADDPADVISMDEAEMLVDAMVVAGRSPVSRQGQVEMDLQSSICGLRSR